MSDANDESVAIVSRSHGARQALHVRTVHDRGSARTNFACGEGLHGKADV
jgi:hypothetical protein